MQDNQQNTKGDARQAQRQKPEKQVKQDKLAMALRRNLQRRKQAKKPDSGT